ncbi:F-box protein VBF-like [Momordica charantia]|uniref:F-box protein VBF-like n=1 Tax=Momordica charantia TaxID=3673 RepID=A0A6J1DQK9_MOMCH|nr:F-box protein VBF-like [Momordica charantia]
MAGILSIGMLPEDCVSTILSLTTPSDVGRLSVVSSAFRSAAESDVVWGRFLPNNYAHILAAADISGESPFCSKREIFFRLCSPLLLDGGKKSLELEKISAKICYTLSARELSISWSSDPLCWSWKNHSHSRFAEVAELRTVSWLEISGKIRTKTVSSNTLYGAYLLVKISDRAYGLDLVPAQVCVQVGDGAQAQVSEGSVWLQRKDKKKEDIECLFYGNRRERVRKLVGNGEKMEENGSIRVLKEREDGWLEIELGEFFSGENGTDEEVKMSLMEIKGFQLKAGLVLQGIQIRPKH